MFENVTHFGLQEKSWTVDVNQQGLVCLMNMSNSQPQRKKLQVSIFSVIVFYGLTLGNLYCKPTPPPHKKGLFQNDENLVHFQLFPLSTQTDHRIRVQLIKSFPSSIIY